MKVTLLDEPTPGAAAARNRGLKEATMQWVCFFDSDDLFDADFLSDLAPFLSPETDMLAVPTRMEIDGKLVTRRYKPTADPTAQILWSHLNTQGMLFRTEWLRDIGGWNERAMVWNDWELGLRALLHQPRLKWLCKRPYHIIKVHADSLTGATFSERGAERLEVMDMAAKMIADCKGWNAQQKRRMQKALCLRLAILRGRLRKENASDFEISCNALQKPTQKSARLEASLIEWLTAKGLPGTWWLAWCLVKSL